VESWEEAEFLTPVPNLQTCQEQAPHERAQLKLSVAKEDERHMVEWRRLHSRMWWGRKPFRTRRGRR
jgi:hypothetical protein